MKKRTATVKCKLYEDEGIAYPRVVIEGERYSLQLAIVGIMKSYINNEVADVWTLQKLAEYAEQPDEDSRAEYLKRLEKEYREKIIKEMEDAWHDAKRNHNSKQQTRDTKEDNQ